MIAVPSNLSWKPSTSSTSPPPVRTGHLSPADRLENLQPHYHRNQQYSIVALTNAAGTLVERYTYSAYGMLGIYAANGTVRTSSTYANRYTYTGREWDPELNLYHFRARWYDPATGGFISRDPLGYVDGMSLYRGYFAVHTTDPRGKNLYAIDGSGANYNGDAELGKSAVARFYDLSQEWPKYYWDGTGSAAWSDHGLSGFSNTAIMRGAYDKICKDFCKSKIDCRCGRCEDITINLVGWSRGAVAVVKVAEWLNDYGCECLMDTKHWFKTSFRPVMINFIGLYDAVSMHIADEALRFAGPVGWVTRYDYTNVIPPNVKFSAALWRTELGGSNWFPFPQLRYRNATEDYDFYIDGTIKTDHSQAGRHQQALDWMVNKAKQQGVKF